MSRTVWRRVVLTCDSCWAALRGVETAGPLSLTRAVREEAKRLGWQRRGDLDLCPTCSPGPVIKIKGER